MTKLVTPEQPAAGEPVEFEITVSNSGDEEAIGIEVIDQLPAGLEIPPGMAAFVSQGFYDPASGQWSVGDLVASASAVMTLPAQKDGTQSSPCLVNTASVEPLPGDTVPENDSASAGVREPGVERCIDLYLENLLFSVPQPICTNQSRASLTMWVRNRGPGEARQVSVSFSDTPQRLPNFRFNDSDCTVAQTGRCEVGTIEAGGLRVLEVVSDDFSNGSAYDVRLQVNLDSADSDYDVTDNETVVMRVVPRLVDSDCGLPEGGIGVGSPSCFIATAAWGDAWDDEVMTLRGFRDRHLLTNAPGRAFVRWYYHNSPPLARFIEKRPVARAAVRGGLTPIVQAIRHPQLAVLSLLAAVTCTLMLIRYSHGIVHPDE
ncbi:MAG: DUF11 domain-containing protein [Gammaproteobacteria bacterium]|nr:DUF11 domain-containing protein [Gammaproteobacteria bacterium]